MVALNGGPLAVQATCQILPPTIPGYRPYCPYTILPDQGGTWTAPNLAMAERLVRPSGTRGDRVTVLYGQRATALPHTGGGPLPRIGSRRARIPGIVASCRERVRRLLGRAGQLPRPDKAGFFSWYQDYPAPSDFIDPAVHLRLVPPENQDNLTKQNSATLASTPRLNVP